MCVCVCVCVCVCDDDNDDHDKTNILLSTKGTQLNYLGCV